VGEQPADAGRRHPQAELGQLAAEATVAASRILPGKPQHQFSNFSRQLRPSTLARRASHRDADIRFLTVEELEALLDAVPDDELGRVDRVIYLTAAMTGLRRGELVALRWQDIDWQAGLMRVRRSYTRGEFASPKSRRSSRAVPMADRVAGELERHFQRSHFQADTDLVFSHPRTGGVYDPSKLRKRFTAAVRRAGLRPIRFHDLRHTFGTRMAAAGAPLRAIQEWLGHSDYRTTSLYADYAPDSSQGAVWAERAFGDTSAMSGSSVV
jgi:integrase